MMVDKDLVPAPLPTGTEAEWAARELGHAALGDARRTQRLVQLAAAWAAQPTTAFPDLAGAPAASKAQYRFFDLPQRVFDRDIPAAIRQAHGQATGERLAGAATVLAVQDTTSLDFTHHPATEDLGPLETARRVGLFVHSTLAVGTDGQPYGLLAQAVWAREPAARGQRHTRRQRPVSEKESAKWLRALAASRQAVPAGVPLVHVGDQEADVYDLFVAAQAQPETELVVRATGERRVATPQGTLRATLLAQPVADTRTVTLPRADERPTRDARLTLRYTRLTLPPPAYRAAEQLRPVSLDAVLVQEVEAPAGVEPIEWLLLTTVPVDSVDAAWERVRWYTYRWRIERYHLVLKSGLRLESRQLGTAARLDCCLAVASVIASRLLELTYAARTQPEAPADALVSTDEWTVVWTARHPDQPVPSRPTLRQAVREIAGLGGFLGRRRDGEPGVITLWRGLQRLHDLLQGYYLAQSLHPDVGKA
jgi:hypothetical protein